MPRRRTSIGPPPLSDPRDPLTRCAMPGGGDPYALIRTDEPERPPEPVLLTICEVAARLRMSEKSVRRRIKEGGDPRRSDRRTAGADLVPRTAPADRWRPTA